MDTNAKLIKSCYQSELLGNEVSCGPAVWNLQCFCHHTLSGRWTGFPSEMFTVNRSVCVKKMRKEFHNKFVYEIFYYLYLLFFSLNASDVWRPHSVRKFSVKTNLVKRSSHGLTNMESQPSLHYNYSIALQHHFLPYHWSCFACSPTQQSQP